MKIDGVTKYTFRSDDPEFENYLDRIAKENFEDDGKVGFIASSNYEPRAIVILQESFIRKFDERDGIVVAGRPLAGSWGSGFNTSKLDHPRYVRIEKKDIKQVAAEIQKALEFKRKVKVAVFTFGEKPVEK